MIQSSGITTIRKTFACVMPPLAVATTAFALYQIFQQSRSREEKILQAAAVAFLGTLVLCSTNTLAQKIFKKEFWKEAVFSFSTSPNLIPAEILIEELLIFSTERTKNNLELKKTYEQMEILSDYQHELKQLRACYLLEQDIDFETAAEEMQQIHQKIHRLEESLLTCLQLLQENNVLNHKEKKLLSSLMAKKRVYDENHKIFTDLEVSQNLEKQKNRCIQQSMLEFDKDFNYQKCSLNPVHVDYSWTEASNDTFDYKIYQVGKEVGICEAKGRRDDMEDAILSTMITIEISGHQLSIPLLGVFDGHLGSFKARRGLKASEYVKDRLPVKLEEKIEYFLNHFSENALTDTVLYNALNHALIELHEEHPGLNGTTVNIGLIANNAIYSANIGDSRSIFVDNEGEGDQLTEDSEANNPRHQKIIHDLGGIVSFAGNSWRVSGIIGMGSALGDPEITGMNPTVDITKKPIPPGGGIYLIACDGLWDTISSKNACKILFENRELSSPNLAKNMIFSAWKAGSQDNLSAVVLKL